MVLPGHRMDQLMSHFALFHPLGHRLLFFYIEHIRNSQGSNTGNSGEEKHWANSTVNTIHFWDATGCVEQPQGCCLEVSIKRTGMVMVRYGKRPEVPFRVLWK